MNNSSEKNNVMENSDRQLVAVETVLNKYFTQNKATAETPLRAIAKEIIHEVKHFTRE